MSDAPDIHALSERIAVMEERMKTMQSEYRTDIARLAEDMAKRDAARSEREMARTERDANARWWQTAILIAAIAALITFAPDLQRIAAGTGAPNHSQSAD